MKIFIYLFTTLVFFNSVLTSQNTNNINSNDVKTIKLVFSKSVFHDIKMEEASATTQILANHIKKSNNLDNEFKVFLANDEQELIKLCKEDFDYVLLATEQYLRLKQILPLEPFTTNYTDKNFGYIYHLIVNKKDSIDDIKQLLNNTIHLQSHPQDQTASIWLNKLLREASIKNRDKFFKEIVFDSKATNVLLPVFFNKAKACIITSASFKLLLELNPGIKNQIKILYTSEPIILGLSCLNSKKKDSDTYKILKESIPALNEGEYGKQFLKLFKTDKVVLFKEEYLKGYYNLIK